MVRNFAQSPMSIVTVLLKEKRGYTLSFHFSSVLVSLKANPWPLGGTSLFIDLYGQVRYLPNQEDIPCLNRVDIISW